MTTVPSGNDRASGVRSHGTLTIVAGDFVTTGGMDRANYALASYAARSRSEHELHVVAHRVAPDLLAQPPVRVHRVPKPLGSYLLGGPLLNRVGARVGRRTAAAGGRVVVNGGNCDVGDVNWVHYLHAAYTPATAGGAARRWKNAWAHRRFLVAERRILAKARLVIANSHRTRRDLVERLGIAPDRIHVVYYGNDPAVFAPASPETREAARRRLGLRAEQPVAVFIGALGDRRKGFDTLFDAWRTLGRRDDWDVTLLIVGQGAELPAWVARAADAGIVGRVQFLGFRRDVPDILAAADLLVAPTRYEAYGLGVHEALCCGLPAIVSRDAGVAEQFGPSLAELLLDQPSDEAELTRRLLAWRADMAAYHAAVRPLTDALRTRTWDHMAHDILRLIFDDAAHAATTAGAAHNARAAHDDASAPSTPASSAAARVARPAVC